MHQGLDHIDGFQNDVNNRGHDGHFALSHFIENAFATMRHIHQMSKSQETRSAFHAMHGAEDFVQQVGVIGIGLQGEESLIEHIDHLRRLG